MLLYVYALADDLADVGGLSGLEDEPLALIPAGDILAVAGWIGEVPAVERDNLIAQDRLVRELHRRSGALLPMRYGTYKPHVNDVARAVEALGPELRTRLDLVRGREQMTIRAFAPTAASVEPPLTVAGDGPELAGPGARYLAERATRTIPRELSPLREALKSLQRATRVEAGRHAGLIGTLYQLVDRGSSAEYRRVAEDAARQSPTMTVRITGPSPAYAFAASP